jgi:tRNA(fMet)-specific endonuclease VapC
MSYLIDTDVVINALNGRQQDDILLQRLSSQELFISLITYGEIYEGIYSSRNPTIDEQIFRRFLRGVDVLPLTKLIMRRFARIRGELRRAGTIIGDTDILIAATALQHNLTLVTHNTHHFQRVPGLVLFR